MGYYMENFECKEKLLEPDIKSIVLNHLIEKEILTCSDTVFSEFTVDSASRRVDLAIAKEGELWAFEIKSEADSLARLKGQADIYLKYFDKVFVVVAQKHIQSALEMLPTSIALWGIKGKSVIIKRRGRKKIIKDPRIFINMMGVSDLIKASNRSGVKSESKRREDLVRSLDKISYKALREAAFEAITQKYKLSSDDFFEKIKGRDVRSGDIKLLSRFKPVSVIEPANSDRIEDIISALNSIRIDIKG